MGTTATIARPSVPPPAARLSGDPTDHRLVAAVRTGDDRAFETLYERYHRRIAAYIYGMVSDYARAEDIAQDVFMSALRRMRDTDRPIAFKPWIYEIAKNACIDQFRRSRRAEEVSYDADDGLGAADHGRLVTSGPAPEVAVDQKMSLDHLCGAFGGLSETHHEILVMRELEGLSYREIGEKLGMSRPSVESTLFRARRRLTEEYEELISGERCRRIQAIIAGASDGALGARDGRRMARHVSYCQSCRRQARLAGIDAGVLARTPVRARVAAFLPFPAFLRRRWGGGGSDSVNAMAAGHAPTVAQWSAVATDPSAVGWAKAAAAAATLAIAGVGAGAATSGQSLGISHDLPGASIVRHTGAGAGAAIVTNRRSTGGAPAPSVRTAPSSVVVHESPRGSGGNAASDATTSLPDAGAAPVRPGGTGDKDSGGAVSGAPVEPIVPLDDPSHASRPQSGGSGGSSEAGSLPSVPTQVQDTAGSVGVPDLSGADAKAGSTLGDTVDAVKGAVGDLTGQ